MAIIEKSTLAKPSNLGEEKYVYPITSADCVLYDEETHQTVKDKLDELVEEMEGMTYEPMAIKSFIASPSYVEKGNIIKSITFTFEFNRLPKSITLKVGGNTYEITNTLESYTVNGLNIKSTTQCTITVYDNKNGYATKTISMAERRRYFYGVASSFSKLTDLGNIISALKEMSLTVNADGNKHIYFCCPINSINDRTVFNVGGFEGGFTLLGLTNLNTIYNGSSLAVSNDGVIKTLSSGNITNTDSASGSNYNTTQTYAIYESDNAGLGNITFKVS